MTSVKLAYPVECPPERVRALLLDERFLHALVDQQHPRRKTIRVDHSSQRSTLSWRIRLEGELPKLVTRFAGRVVDLRLVFDLRASKLKMTANAHHTGNLSCDFLIRSHGSKESVLLIDGTLLVSGPFGSKAEEAVRDKLVKPVFRKGLVRLLNEWA